MQLVLVYLYWFRRNSLLKCVTQSKVTTYILVFKVIALNANQKPVYDFLLVINSNLGPILHCFWDTATYWLKIANFPTPSHLALSLGVIPFEVMEKLYGSWK